MRKVLMGMAVTAALAIAAPAEAAVDYTVSGAGSGTFSLELTGSAYALTALDLTFGSAGFSLSNADVETFSPFVTLGGASQGVYIVTPLSDDFTLGFNPTVALQERYVFYWNAGNQNYVEGFVTITQVAAAVPEPGTWGMMLLGFGATSVALRRSRRRAPAWQD